MEQQRERCRCTRCSLVNQRTAVPGTVPVGQFRGIRGIQALIHVQPSVAAREHTAQGFSTWAGPPVTGEYRVPMGLRNGWARSALVTLAGLVADLQGHQQARVGVHEPHPHRLDVELGTRVMFPAGVAAHRLG